MRKIKIYVDRNSWTAYTEKQFEKQFEKIVKSVRSEFWGDYGDYVEEAESNDEPILSFEEWVKEEYWDALLFDSEEYMVCDLTLD